MDYRQLIAAGALALLLILEALVPFYADARRNRRRLLAHDARNLLLGGFNAALSGALVAVLLTAADHLAAQHNFGLLRRVAAPPWVELAIALVAFDFWMYWWHVANHRTPFLWRFHRMHHSDPAMDATTGVRFHPGEALLSGLARAAVLPLLGMTVAQMVLYEAILLPVILFHHSNVSWPRWLDYGGMRLVVTPAMHRVHHSQLVEETNSNYGSVLPVWDRLFGSLRVRADAHGITFGLKEFAGERWHTLRGMLGTPLGRSGRRDERERRDDQ